MNDILYASLHKYYSNDKNINKFNDCINGPNKISLRVIDWFVTNYSKKFNIYYEIYKTPSGKMTFNSEDDVTGLTGVTGLIECIKKIVFISL